MFLPLCKFFLARACGAIFRLSACFYRTLESKHRENRRIGKAAASGHTNKIGRE